jgi:hypothetical protein
MGNSQGRMLSNLPPTLSIKTCSLPHCSSSGSTSSSKDCSSLSLVPSKHTHTGQQVCKNSNDK